MCTCVYSAYVIVCLYAGVCAYVYVASQSRCSIRCIFIIFKSNFTAYIPPYMSYLMWNRVPCSQHQISDNLSQSQTLPPSNKTIPKSEPRTDYCTPHIYVYSVHTIIGFVSCFISRLVHHPKDIQPT